MKLHREFFVVCYIFVLLLNDPGMMRACMLDRGLVYAPANGFERRLLPGFPERSGREPHMNPDSTDIHLYYVLDGGRNSDHNPDFLTGESLPFVPDVPVREGYNFAGWYTDGAFTHKITEIRREHAGNLVLYAKWTDVVDSSYSVEMYPYRSGGVLSGNYRELKECSYGFLDGMAIPGMPSTREKDYLRDLIGSEGQCGQGLCFTPELILITSYAEDSGVAGSLMIFDRESGAYLATLRMKKNSHLGGIAFDGENVWICHSGSNTLERMSYAGILEIVEEMPGGSVDASGFSEEYKIRNTPSCITCYGGRIWVATHTKLFNSQMLSYSYDAAEDTLVSLGSYHIPSRVQGIAFDGEGAVYLSTSYGRNNSSYLKVYSSLLMLTRKPNAPEIRVEMPPCSEEIAIAGEHVYVLFESASRKYFEGTDGNGMSPSPIDKLLEVEVASIW